MARTDLSDVETDILNTLSEEGSADLYALARSVGMGPRSIQAALQRLARDGLVDVADRGASFRCTRDGQRAVSGKHAP
jgi:Mn-dependent DtxR family transcriptional regulator